MKINLFVSGLSIWLIVTWFGTLEGRLVYDLTHTLDSDAPKWPVQGISPNLPAFEYFKSTTLFADYSGTAWIAFNAMELYEHMGTHIDAPNHFGKGRPALHEIPPERLIGPGVVIDVTDKVKNNMDYAVTVQDIKDHEAKYGMIPPNAVVIMNSGWGNRYPNPEQMFGTNNVSDSSTFRFPGFSMDACLMLLKERQVYVVGVDTPSVDPGNSVTYDCHVLLQPNDVVLIEYAAKLDTLPPRNTTIVVGSPKFRGGTGAPTRLLAFLDKEDDSKCVSSAATSFTYVSILACIVQLLL